MLSAKVIKADATRRIALHGVAEPVPRPVDVDQTLTGFKTLRTLRIYRFSPPAVIDGHAEDDEVYIVVLCGSVDLIMRSTHWNANDVVHTLTAATLSGPVNCAAYLPPQAEYRLTPRNAADIAYVRAMPSLARAPAVISSAPLCSETGVYSLLKEEHFAERLRLQLQQIDAGPRGIDLAPMRRLQDRGESLLYVRTTPTHGAAGIKVGAAPIAPLESWDTVVVENDDDPTLHVAAGSSVLALTAYAT